MGKLRDKGYIELKAYRTRCKLRQEDMANIIGTTVSNYSQKESGNITITLPEAFEIHKGINKILEKNGLDKITMEKLFFRQ